jgi:hypothetical protein
LNPRRPPWQASTGGENSTNSAESVSLTGAAKPGATVSNTETVQTVWVNLPAWQRVAADRALEAYLAAAAQGFAETLN